MNQLEFPYEKTIYQIIRESYVEACKTAKGRIKPIEGEAREDYGRTMKTEILLELAHQIENSALVEQNKTIKFLYKDFNEWTK